MQFFTIIRPVDVFTLAAYRKTGGMPGLRSRGGKENEGMWYAFHLTTEVTSVPGMS